jgi:CspA family cold shock protein
MRDCGLAMPEGTVKFFNQSKGYGFIKPDRDTPGTQADVFIHIREVKKCGLESVAEGQRVKFEIAPAENGKGPKAVSIAVL